MQRAGLTASNSPSSILAECFIDAIGVSSLLTSNQVDPIKNASLSNKYSEKLKKYARSIESWKPFAKGLSASISKSGSVSVGFSGTPEEEEAVKLLEFGSPGNPPQSVLRVMEEELRQDYVQDSSGTRI